MSPELELSTDLPSVAAEYGATTTPACTAERLQPAQLQQDIGEAALELLLHTQRLDQEEA